MESSNKGYIFDCREDVFGSIGVMESYKSIEKNGKLIVDVICSVDNTGKVLKPACNNISDGFTTIDVGGVSTFVKSNKPCFGKFGDFIMLAVAKIVFNKEDSSFCAEDSKVTFYLPKTVSHKLKPEPVLICDRVSPKDGLNVFRISDITLHSYMKNFFSGFSMENVSSREAYLRGRLE